MINFCNIVIQRNNIVNHTNEYLLGLAFMYNYYTVINFDNQTIGFNGKIIDFDPTANQSTFPLWILILVACVIAIAGISICCFIRIRNKRLEAQLDDYDTVP